MLAPFPIPNKHWDKFFSWVQQHTPVALHVFFTLTAARAALIRSPLWPWDKFYLCAIFFPVKAPPSPPLLFALLEKHTSASIVAQWLSTYVGCRVSPWQHLQVGLGKTPEALENSCQSVQAILSSMDGLRRKEFRRCSRNTHELSTCFIGRRWQVQSLSTPQRPVCTLEN